MRSTLAEMYWPLMDLPSVRLRRCAVCGATWPLNQHHAVWRGWGKLFDADGNEREKPTITLCGSGNTGGCHGLAHAHRLHFRNNGGRWEYLLLDRPLRYERAIEIEEGWEPCNTY